VFGAKRFFLVVSFCCVTPHSVVSFLVVPLWSSPPLRCFASIPTIKRPTIKSLPNTLVIALNRFSTDFTQEPPMAVKINDKVAFPLVLDMNPYTVRGREKAEQQQQRRQQQQHQQQQQQQQQDMGSESHGGKQNDETKQQQSGAKDDAPDSTPNSTPNSTADSTASLRTMTEEEQEGLYELCGITIHSGNANSGHYWSYAKDRATNSWNEFNDDSVTSWDINDVERDCFGGAISQHR